MNVWLLALLAGGVLVALYVSARRKDSEPAAFFEPGLFVVRRGGELFFAATQNMPWSRPSLTAPLEWLPRAIEHAVPARGEQAPEVFTRPAGDRR